MHTASDRIFHSRLSFALNVKLLAPLEVAQATAAAHRRDPERCPLAATEAFAEVPVYARTGLAAGHIVSGPALIVEDETTTFLSARFDARIDSIGSIVLERRS